MITYERTGTVEMIGDVQSFASGFTKREVVIGNPPDRQNEYPNPVMFAFKKDRCGLLDNVEVGDVVKVKFSIDGRKWDGPNGTRYFTELTAWQIDVIKASDGAEDDTDVKAARETETAKNRAISAWRKYNPGDKSFNLLTKLCKQLKPGKSSNEYAATDWNDITKAIEGEAQAAADAAKGSDDIDDLPF